MNALSCSLLDIVEYSLKKQNLKMFFLQLYGSFIKILCKSVKGHVNDALFINNLYQGGHVTAGVCLSVSQITQYAMDGSNEVCMKGC